MRPGVLISLDTTNRNALDCYGPDRGVTPHLAALAAESLVFDEARAVAPLTVPSHTSMLTGLYPLRHTVRDNGFLPLPAAAETLAERARDAGCRTGAFLAAAVLRTTTGLAQGFETYDEPSARTASFGGIGERAGAEVTRAAIAWLDARADDRPYFLWAHYYDPHHPYEPPEQFLQQAGGHPYLGEVAAMDAAVGALLERLRREPDWDATTVVVVGDHGESGGRHGETTHGLLAYDATLRVPLLVRLPGTERAGERSAAIASIVDAYPTLLASMGVGAPASDGVDLRGTVAPDRGAYFEAYYGYLNYGWSPLAGWASAAGKYIHGPDPEFYEVDRDEGEEQNRIAAHAADVARAREALEALARRPALQRGADERNVAGDGDGLLELGYAGAGATDGALPGPLDDADLPDPRTRLDEHIEVWMAVALVNAGKVDQAIDKLRAIAASNPRNTFALDRMSELLVEAGRPSEALEPLRALVALGVERPAVRNNLARAYLALGRREEAREQVDAFRALWPDDPKGEELAAALAAGG